MVGSWGVTIDNNELGKETIISEFDSHRVSCAKIN